MLLVLHDVGRFGNGLDAALVHPTQDAEEAVLAPFLAPAVLDEPVPEARGAEETQMTPLESTQNRSRIDPESTGNRPRTPPESPGRPRETPGDPQETPGDPRNTADFLQGTFPPLDGLLIEQCHESSPQ